MVFKTRYIVIAVSVLVALGIMYYFSNLVAYIILAWSVSMIGSPFFKLFKKFLGKNLAALLTLFIFILFGAIMLWIFIPPLLQQARNISNIDYAKAIDAIEEPINDWQKMLENRGFIKSFDIEPIDTTIVEIDEKPFAEAQIIHLDSIIRNDSILTGLTIMVNVNHKEKDKNPEPVIQQNPNKTFFDAAKENIVSFINPKRIQNILSGMVGFLGNFIIGIFSILFISFFFLREQGLFTGMITNIVPDRFEVETAHAVKESSRLLVRYFIGIATQIIVITTLVSLLLSLFGIKNALLIGFFAALMNVIPYIGPILGATFAMIITFTSNLDLSFYNELLPVMGKVLIVFFIMQMIDNFLIQPFIFGRSVKAHPLEIFLIVLVGAQMGGIIGMVLAIPVYTVLRVVAKVFLSEFKIIQKLTQSI